MQNVKQLRRSTEASRDFTTVLAEIWRRRIQRALGVYLAVGAEIAIPGSRRCFLADKYEQW